MYTLFLPMIVYKSGRPSLILFIPFSFCFSDWITTTVLFYRSLILSSDWSSLVLRFSVEFFSSFIVFFSSNICLVLFYVFNLSAKLLIFLYSFSDIVKLFICALLQFCEHIQNSQFELFVKQFLDLHLLGFSYCRFTVFFWWSHVSFILHDPYKLAQMSAHLNKQSPRPDYWVNFSKGRFSVVGKDTLRISVTSSLVVQDTKYEHMWQHQIQWGMVSLQLRPLGSTASKV